MVGPRSFSPIRSPIFPAQLSGAGTQFVSFSCCHSLVHFWLCRHATGIEFRPRGSHRTTSFTPPAKQTVGYAMEKPVPSKKTSPAVAVPTLTLDERRATNAKELERLHGMEEQLKLRKRDLLHSDTEGNRLYAIDLASYNDALAKATAEKNALASAK